MDNIFLEDMDLLEIVQLESIFKKNKDSDIYDKYGYIKITDKVDGYSIYGHLIKDKKSSSYNSQIQFYKKQVDSWGKNIDLSHGFEYLEQLAHYNLDKSKLIEYMEKYKGNASINRRFSIKLSKYSTDKEITNKTLTFILEDNASIYYLYCHEDDCCYVILNDGTTYKITIQDLLQASRRSYKDLIELINKGDK